MQTHDATTLKRRCLAVAVPSGKQVMIREGASVEIVQALGTSFTLKVQGRLFRVEGTDADALGRKPVEAPRLPAGTSDEEVERMVWDRLKTCYDPEIPINIVDLGLIYACDITRTAKGARRVDVAMTLTAPGCGIGHLLTADVWQQVMEVPSVEEVQVKLVFDPPWNASMMSEEARLETGLY